MEEGDGQGMGGPKAPCNAKDGPTSSQKNFTEVERRHRRVGRRSIDMSL